MVQKVVILLGPTASGKTGAAIAAAKALRGEIVSCDSMQIYDEIHIGTARPLIAEQEGIPHHLMGFLPPNATYSVSEFQRDAKAAIADISARGKLPILVGGTGLYINAITYELDFTETQADEALRQQLSQEYDRLGGEVLHARLAEADPAYAAKIHPNDKRRIIRRLEVLAGGKAEPYDFNCPSREYDFLLLGIQRERPSLYAAIEQRVDAMLEQGLEEEARSLVARYGREIQPMQAIGYKEFLPYFDGEASLADAVALLKRNTRRFAKRQMTWFRRDSRIIWLDAETCAQGLPHAIIERIKSFLAGD